MRAPALQGAASTEEASQPASELCAGRGHWHFFTVPEAPAAGGQAVIYFNKACSDPLRCLGCAGYPSYPARMGLEPWHWLIAGDGGLRRGFEHSRVGEARTRLVASRSLA